MPAQVQEFLLETESGKCYLLFVHLVPHDCVIQYSANGYWVPQGSYDKSKIVGYERYFGKDGSAHDQIGYTHQLEGIGWFRNMAHVREFFVWNLRDPIAHITNDNVSLPVRRLE